MSRRPLHALVTTLLAGLLLAGCSDGSDPDPDPDPGAGSTSPEPSASGTGASESPTAPAGLTLETAVGTIDLPEGWTPERGRTTSIQKVASSPGGSTVTLYDLGEVGRLGVPEFSDVMREYTLVEQPRLSTSEELDGATTIRVDAGAPSGDSVTYTDVGGLHEGYAATVTFSLSSEEMSPREQQDFIDTVLASYTWR